MAYFINGYPYSDTHNLNLDWVIDTLKRVETEIGQLHDGLEIHVTDTSGTEIYTFTVKANGVYITRTDGGTPFFYNFDTQTLHAPYFDGQSFLFATGRTTGQMRAGSLVLDNALPIAQGGTGKTSAAEARAALGAVNKAGDTMTGPLNMTVARIYHASYPTFAFRTSENGSNIASIGVGVNDNTLAFIEKSPDTSHSENYYMPNPDSGLGSDKYYKLLTSKNITKALLSVNNGSAIGDTNAHTATLTEAPANYLGAVIAVGWQAITDATGFVFVPSIRWNANSAMRIYSNNNPAEQYVTISARTANGLTYQASNSSMALAVYGLIHI